LVSVVENLSSNIWNLY